jgi:Amt family ammonium transporter
MASGTAGMAWSFAITTLLCWIFHFIPGLCLRSGEEEEIIGIDDAYLGEWAYDFVGADPELRTHLLSTASELEPMQHDEPERIASQEATQIGIQEKTSEGTGSV